MDEKQRFIDALRKVVIDHTENFITDTEMAPNGGTNWWAKGYISALGNFDSIITLAKMDVAIQNIEDSCKRMIAEEAKECPARHITTG